MDSRRTIRVTIFLLLVLAGHGALQAVAHPYMAQQPPGDVPELFAPGAVSLDGNVLREYTPSFWPDGLRFFFPRFGNAIPAGTILEARFVDGVWGDPAPSTLFPNGAFEPSLSPDGQRIFFNPPDFSAPHGALALQMMELGPDGWSAPIPLFNGIYASADLEGTLYYTTFYLNKDHIAYRVPQGDGYSREKLVEDGILSDRHEDAHPCIAPDGSYLIFDSETRLTSESCRLFVAFRNEDGFWTDPAHMGGVIGDLRAALARISPDGKYLFFKADGDIYWVDASVVETLR